MDRSGEYIDKCIKAEEIQISWEMIDGDYYLPLRDETVLFRVCILNDWETRTHIVENRNAFIWLPRLDQLQNMIDWTRWEFKITKKTHIEMHYAAISGELSSGTVFGETMGQVWLAFVMKAKYGKIWEPEQVKWVTA